jgi:NAD(P)-dependent dehydrogenase (short-subunit alcohol dehydrogenase family)
VCSVSFVLHDADMSTSARDSSHLSDTFAVITGSTDGVGRVVAQRLAAAGAHVIVHGRNVERGQQVVDDITAHRGRARFIAADLSSMAEVRRLAKEIERSSDRLNLLINNAGIGTGGGRGHRETSLDGYELRFAVNYLSGFLLTSLLLPRLKTSAPARIVNVASVGQQAIDFDDVMLTQGYSGGRAYMQSKLAQVMFTFDVARETAGAGVTVNCLHPATYMNTTMVRQAGVTPWSTVEEGAEAILNLAISPELEGKSGLYFDGLHESRANPQAYDEEARRSLAELSQQLTSSVV